MHDLYHETTCHQQQMTTTPATSGARYAVGPSTDGRNGDASAPGVAEGLGHQGVPEQETRIDAPEQPPAVPDVEADALRRVARRRQRMIVQRKKRVDVRYSVEEKGKIMARAEAMEIAGAHLVGAIVMSYLDGNLALALPGQRTGLDDCLDELDALRRQVAKIGGNVTQIAKRLNSGGDPHPVDTAILTQAERTLVSVRAAIGDIAEAMNRAVSSKAA